jgi:hypothetical protein
MDQPPTLIWGRYPSVSQAQEDAVFLDYADTKQQINEEREAETVTVQETEKWFNDRADRWELESGIYSSPAATFLNEDYQCIIGKGEMVIPFIMKRLETSTRDWFWALEHIAPDAKPAVEKDKIKNFDEAIQAWRSWALNKGIFNEK